LGEFENAFMAAFWGEEVSPLPDWVEWQHISEGLTHCEVCLKLDKCWFTDETKPLLPQHPHCHCVVEVISPDKVRNEARSECDIRKFNAYIFNPEYDDGKMELFESWGYDILDSEMLQKEYEHQALEKYIKGEYTLGKLDKEGQRISISIELSNKNKDIIVTAISGWMVYPEGKIRLNTPLAGGKKK